MTMLIFIRISSVNCEDRNTVKVLADSSVSFGSSASATNPPLRDVWVYALQDENGLRYLSYGPCSPGMAYTIRQSAAEMSDTVFDYMLGWLFEADIVSATKITRMWVPNIIVDLAYRENGQVHVMCIAGPRGRVKTIFAALGHPV